MWKVFVQQSSTFGPIYQRMSKHPSWVSRTAITCTLAIIFVPMIVLILFALLVGVAVFYLLAAVATVMGWFGMNKDSASASHADDVHRENVRVIDDEPMGF